MPELGTYGSVGAPGRQRLGATRQRPLSPRLRRAAPASRSQLSPESGCVERCSSSWPRSPSPDHRRTRSEPRSNPLHERTPPLARDVHVIVPRHATKTSCSASLRRTT